MLYCNLAGLMANKKANISDVSRDTKISRTTLTSLYYNTLKGIQIETADALCKYFNVGMDKLFIFSKYDFSADCVGGDSELTIFEDLMEHAHATVDITVKIGSVFKKCDIGVTVYAYWLNSERPEFEFVIEYYDPEVNDGVEENNIFLQKIFGAIPAEIKPHIEDMITDCVDAHFMLSEHYNYDCSVTNNLW